MSHWVSLFIFFFNYKNLKELRLKIKEKELLKFWRIGTRIEVSSYIFLGISLKGETYVSFLNNNLKWNIVDLLIFYL